MGNGSDIFAIVELIMQGIIRMLNLLIDMIFYIFTPSRDSQNSKQSDYDRLTSKYIGNMSPKQQKAVLAAATEANSKVKNSPFTGQDVVDYMKINQKEKIDELQKELNIKDPREFKGPNETKEQFAQRMASKVNSVRMVPSMKSPQPNAFVTHAPAADQQITVNSADGKKFSSYYSESDTKIPAEILVTGNVNILQSYVDYAVKNKILDPKSKDILHLKERIQAMMQLNVYAEYNLCNKKQADNIPPADSKDKVQVNVKGENKEVSVIAGAKLGRKQDTVNGGWACAMEVMLSGQGIHVDQALIKEYKPEFVNLGEGPKDPKEIDILLSDSKNSIQEYAELVGKVSPNTMVRTMNSASNNTDVMLKKVDSLIFRNVPVSFSDGEHWKTIVGQDDVNFYVIDPAAENPNALIPVEKASFAKDKSCEFTWMERMQVNEAGEIKDIDPDHFTVNTKSGAVVKGPFASQKGFESSVSMQTGGHFFESGYMDSDINETLNVSTYIPKAFRKYEMDYSAQRELIEQDIPSPKAADFDMANYKFTYMSDFSKENVQKKLELAAGIVKPEELEKKEEKVELEKKEEVVQNNEKPIKEEQVQNNEKPIIEEPVPENKNEELEKKEEKIEPEKKEEKVELEKKEEKVEPEKKEEKIEPEKKEEKIEPEKKEEKVEPEKKEEKIELEKKEEKIEPEKKEEKVEPEKKEEKVEPEKKEEKVEPEKKEEKIEPEKKEEKIEPEKKEEKIEEPEKKNDKPPVEPQQNIPKPPVEPPQPNVPKPPVEPPQPNVPKPPVEPPQPNIPKPPVVPPQPNVPKPPVVPPYPKKRLNAAYEFAVQAPQSDQYLSMHYLAMDGTALENRAQSYYSNSKTKIPAEILVTGNVPLLKNYVSYAEQNKLLQKNSSDMRYLYNRINAMTQINAYSEYSLHNENKSGPKENDKKVSAQADYGFFDMQVQKIKGAELGRSQDTGNGCWSCAMEVLFSGMGIKIDQSVIRAYKPEFTNLNEGPKAPREIDTIISNSMFSIQECAELVGKISPNTMVNTMSTGVNKPDKVIAKVNSLIAKNVPVAFTDGGHWRTIVGQDIDNYYVIDSNSPTPNRLIPVEKDFFKGKYGFDFTWMEKMQLGKDGQIKGVNPGLFRVNPNSGVIMKGKFDKVPGSVEKTAPLQTSGHFFESVIADPDTNAKLKVSTYLPKAFRKYEMAYDKQKQLIEKDAPSPKKVNTDVTKYKFTYMSDFSMEKTKQKLWNDVTLKLKKEFAGYSWGMSKDECNEISEDLIKDYEKAMLDEKKDPYGKIKFSDKEFEAFYGKNARMKQAVNINTQKQFVI